MCFELSKMPFSRYSSFIGVSGKCKNGSFFIHCARRVFGEDKVFRLSFFKEGDEVIPEVLFYPECLNFIKDNAVATLYIKDKDSLVIDGYGFGVKLELLELASKNGDVPEIYPLSYGRQVGENHFKIISVNARYVIGVHLSEGYGTFYGSFKQNERGDRIEQKNILQIMPSVNRISFQLNIAQDELHPSAYSLPDIEMDLLQIRTEWQKFQKMIPKYPVAYRDAASKSWYNLWSSTVPAEGNYKYPAVVMSMEFMSSVWTWDHCFNALALSLSDIDKGLEQFFLPFELQALNGALPDYINPGLEVVWGVTKPPVHGWCFNKLMEAHELSTPVLEKAYKHLSLWTNWWMNYNDTDADGIPDYPMGCDSGWDNSTVFDLDYFVESPDLCAYLIIQMYTLAKIAKKLDNKTDEVYWFGEAVKLGVLFDEHSWINNRYVAKVSHSHIYDEQPTSLITLMPLVLGHRLDKDKREKLIAALKTYYLTDYGLATECYKGKYYRGDNYWRGSIWAPSTYLIVDGLIDAGEKDLASEIARKFCNMIAISAKGDYENFNALTGEGLRASGYTWTSSVNILLLNYLTTME